MIIPSTTESPDLQSLLTGKHPPIFSSANAPDVFSATAIPSITDPPAFHPPIIPTSHLPPPPRAPPDHGPSHASLSKQLEAAHELTNRLSTRLLDHDRLQQIKAKNHSLGIERCFYAPLQMRLKAAVLAGNGGPIEVSTDGLLDPERFTKRRQNEKKFENRIAEAFEPPKRPKIANRQSFDWKLLDIVRQTRFFDGDQTSHYGKKVVIPTFGDSVVPGINTNPND
jgi:hypothetical protein